VIEQVVANVLASPQLEIASGRPANNDPDGFDESYSKNCHRSR
jgi:hypothetical protein